MGFPFISGVSNKGTVLSWALYDFANSTFSMNVLSLYFVLWVTIDHGAPEFVYGVALSGSMLAVALTSPMLGAVSDRYGRRLPFLVAFSGLCVVATALLGMSGSLVLGLLLFVVANYAYQSGLIYYDALLGTISRQDTQGQVSGIGVGLGYVGTISGVLMVRPFADASGRGAAFLPTALLFFLFALPCFIFVKERGAARWDFAYLSQGYRQLFDTLRESRRYANVLRFIAARFLYYDAISTLVAFMAAYLVKVVGFSDHEAQNLLITSTVSAVLGAMIYGKAVDRFGPRRTLQAVLVQWALIFVAMAFTAHPVGFYLLGAAAGFNLGGMWTTDRVLLTRLAPPERRGEFFGLYGLAGRFSSVIGPMVYGLTLWVLQDWEPVNYRIGILTLCVTLAAGLIVLSGVREPSPVTSGVADPRESVPE